MTVTVTATRTVTNPPDTPNRIPPPPDPAGVTTATGNAGRPDVLIDPGLCWPSVACDGMGDWPFFGPDTERAVSESGTFRGRRAANIGSIPRGVSNWRRTLHRYGNGRPAGVSLRSWAQAPQRK